MRLAAAEWWTKILMPAPKLLVRVYRGKAVESEHYGHVVVADRTGAIRLQIGDAATRVYLRSAAKPVQAIPAIEHGVPEAFGFSESEMALTCASHNGEPFHAETAASMLKKIGLSEQYLQCGIHRPLGIDPGVVPETGQYSVLQNNCSGKHSLMLAACVQADLPLNSYLSPDHPHQIRIRNCLADYGNLPVDDIQVGIDGCSAPVFNMPLCNLATVYAKLADRKLSGYKCFKYMTAHPEMVGGTGRFDTVFMQATAGAAIAKIGAEGLQCVSVLSPEPLGIVVKISDGNNRAAPAVALAVLRKLGLLSHAAAQHLTAYFEPELYNHRGIVIGKIAPAAI